MTSPDVPRLCERLEEDAEWAGTTDHGEELYMTAEAGLALAADLRSAASTIRELLSERDAAREALRPFAAMDEALADWQGDETQAVFSRRLRAERRPSGIREHTFVRLEREHFSAARKALESSNG